MMGRKDYSGLKMISTWSRCYNRWTLKSMRMNLWSFWWHLVYHNIIYNFKRYIKCDFKGYDTKYPASLSKEPKEYYIYTLIYCATLLRVASETTSAYLVLKNLCVFFIKHHLRNLLYSSAVGSGRSLFLLVSFYHVPAVAFSIFSEPSASFLFADWLMSESSWLAFFSVVDISLAIPVLTSSIFVPSFKLSFILL